MKTKTSLETLSSRVQHARGLRGLSARALSVKASLAQALVGQIERNEASDPHGTTIVAIAKALDVDPAWLLTGAGTPPVEEKPTRKKTGT